MSLAETQQIMHVLQEIMQLLNQVDFKTTKLNADAPKTKETLMTFMQLERVALRYLALARRAGLPDNVAQATTMLTQLLIVIRMVQISTTLLMSSTPYGILAGIAGLGLAGMSAYDSMRGF